MLRAEVLNTAIGYLLFSMALAHMTSSASNQPFLYSRTISQDSGYILIRPILDRYDKIKIEYKNTFVFTYYMIYFNYDYNNLDVEP